MTLQSLTQPLLPKQAGDVLHWGQLSGAASALAIAQTAQQYEQFITIVTPDMLSATRLTHEIQFFLGKNSDIPLLIFPDWEILPYDSFSPHQDIISQRLLTLYQLPSVKKGILIVPINTLLARIAPRGYIEANSFVLTKGDKLDINPLRERLEKYGYRNVAQVIEHGEFSVRGSILDLFPMGSDTPYRIDLFDHEVDSIRTFDPETQRSLETIDKIQLLPAREFPLNESAITFFRQSWRSRFTGNPINAPVYQSISAGESAAGIEYYLPLFFEKMATLLDYLPKNTLLIRFNGLYQVTEKYWQEIKERYDQLGHDVTRPILPPHDIFLTIEQIFFEFKQWPQIEIHTSTLENKAANINFSCEALPDLTVDRKLHQPLSKLEQFLSAHPLNQILFSVESLGRRESLLELLKTIHLQPEIVDSWQAFVDKKSKLAISVSLLDEGLCANDLNWTIITESQLFGFQVQQRRLRKQRVQDPENLIRDLTELQIGSPVVHIDHGIGLYRGLQIIKTGEIEAEYLTLEYADGAKLYVPVASLNLIGRYTGVDPDHISLHSLSSKQWEKEKRKAAEKIRDIAAELLEIYAKRAAKTGFVFNKSEADYDIFANDFAFEETPDQQKAITDIIQDMTSVRMMDRLICGDVGFGKTEVAMRAAFIAAHNNKQVAVLVPTTLLAEQHYENFKDRFANWPFKLAVLSRFHSDKTQNKILADIAEGKIDIVVGTHKLLQPSIKFKNLGLLIIDEEHRFGVQQKEKIKSLRSEVDILTLTATPIPRTLNMALSGMRDLSLITTPPARRLAIKTFVRDHNPALIREAMMREIMRGGQIYYLHNDISTIEKTGRELNALVPEARIAIAHGQMGEKELAQVMADFYHQRFNLLVCTTIIESGIDVPTANTIIIDRADKFGLAQLHQLRGRVGRSHHQAYAYLLIPSRKTITKDADKRLDAIESLEDLGAGFMLATHDLEIRGAGELLGAEQSGHIQAIGFSLYMDMLEQAVNALKNGKQPDLENPLHPHVEIDLRIPALLPETYAPDVHLRLTLYKRIANAKDAEQLKELQIELIDRFGLLPPAAQNLFSLAELRLIAEPLGIRKIDASAESARIEFTEQPQIDFKKLITLIQQQPKRYKLDAKQRLIVSFQEQDVANRIAILTRLLSDLKLQH